MTIQQTQQRLQSWRWSIQLTSRMLQENRHLLHNIIFLIGCCQAERTTQNLQLMFDMQYELQIVTGFIRTTRLCIGYFDDFCMTTCVSVCYMHCRQTWAFCWSSAPSSATVATSIHDCVLHALQANMGFVLVIGTFISYCGAIAIIGAIYKFWAHLWPQHFLHHLHPRPGFDLHPDLSIALEAGDSWTADIWRGVPVLCLDLLVCPG